MASIVTQILVAFSGSPGVQKGGKAGARALPTRREEREAKRALRDLYVPNRREHGLQRRLPAVGELLRVGDSFF